MLYQAGDVVLLRDDLEENEVYGNFYVNDVIARYIGEYVTIKNVHGNAYSVVEFGDKHTRITDEMILCRVYKHVDRPIEYVKCAICGEEHDVMTMRSIDGKTKICDDCYYKIEDSIGCYHCKSRWYKKVGLDKSRYTNTLMGFELEFSIKNSNSTKSYYYAYKIKQLMDGLIHCEKDSSVSSGFEIVSEPMTMSYIRESAKDKIKDMFDFIKGTDLYDNRNAGLHIHVDKESLSTTTRSTEETIDNLLLILETFRDEIVQFSRREQTGYWEFLTDGRNLGLSKVKKAKKQSRERYKALNITNDSTIEFRSFQATTNYDTFMATLEFVNNLVNIAKYRNIDGLTWNDIIEYHKSKNKFLAKYNDSLGIESTKAIKTKSYLEENKDKFSLDGFVNGEYAINLNGSSIGVEDRWCAVDTLLYMFLKPKGVSYNHAVYSGLFDCIIAKLSCKETVCVRKINNKNMLVTMKDSYGIENVVDFDEVFDVLLGD